MTPQEIIYHRLSNQLLLNQKYKTPSEVVSWLCAVQAQDYLGSLWAVGLRTDSCTEDDVKQAIRDRSIVRTWPMRGTLNFVAAQDVKWMLKLMSPRILSVNAKRMKRDFDVDEALLLKCHDLFIKALQGGKQLERTDMYKVLEEGGIPATGQRGLHIIWNLAQRGLLCFGSRESKQPSFALLDEWIPESRNLTHEESLAELVYRYFASRGPATIQDLIWWSGLTTSAAKTGLELVKDKLHQEKIGEQTYWMSPDLTPVSKLSKEILLLPPFDEYLIAYKDRSHMLGNYTLKDVVPFSNGMFFPIIVGNGTVTGTWKRTIQKNKVKIEFTPFAAMTKHQKTAISATAQKYSKFLNLEMELIS